MALFSAGWTERLLPTLTVRARLLSLSIVILVFLMVANAVVGFAHVTTQQQSLIALRQQSEEVRAVHQALTQADAEVSRYVLADGRADLGGFYRAIEVLKARRGKTLDRLQPVVIAGSTITRAPQQIIDALESVWLEAIDLVTEGRAGEARALLADRETGILARSVGDAVDLLMDGANGDFAMHEDRISTGTLLVLLLQVGSGVLALVAIIFAFRASATDALGRAVAAES